MENTVQYLTNNEFIELIRKNFKFKYERAKLIDAVLGVNNSSVSLFYEDYTKAEIEDRFNGLIKERAADVINKVLSYAPYRNIKIRNI